MQASNISRTQFSLLEFSPSAGEKVDYEAESRSVKLWLSHFFVLQHATRISTHWVLLVI